jgi:hypothetical protein
MSEQKTELELLKEEATKLGITFSGNIGAPALLAKIDAFKEVNATTSAEPELVVPTTEYKVQESAATAAQRKRKEANKLVRIVATCMNPNKKAMTGEFFSVSNAIIGTVKKYVHFDAEDGWHVPAIIVDHLRERRCQIFVPAVTTTGKKIMKGKSIKEFNVAVLPPLTTKEVTALAERQALAGSIDREV